MILFRDGLHSYENETRKVGDSRDPDGSGLKDRTRGWLIKVSDAGLIFLSRVIGLRV